MRFLRFFLATFVLLPGGLTLRAATPAWEPDGVPYEMTRAGRTRDFHPPLVAFDDDGGWRVESSNSVASVSSSAEHRLFGKGSLKLVYRAKPGAQGKPSVRLVPPKPVTLPEDADALSVWVYGNSAYGRAHGKTVPMTRLFAVFAAEGGGTCEREIEWVNHLEWFCSVTILQPDLRTRIRAGGNRLLALELRGGTNADDQELFLTSLCAFKDETKPLAFRPRAKRGVQVFKGAPQGINIGEGRLPFPNSARTILPPKCASDTRIEFRLPKDPAASWDDLAFRWKGGPWIRLAVGGGVWPEAARTGAQVTFRRDGNSVVADVVAKGGQAEEVRFGALPDVPDADVVPVPYLSFRKGPTERPTVLSFEAKGTPLFVSALADWTQSAASEPFPASLGGGTPAANGGLRYLPKTDGRRNDVYERFVWTVSPDFAATLPTVPNPPSPWKRVTGSGVWRAYSSTDHKADAAFWRKRRRMGLRHLIVTDHETMWRDGDESFTFRTETAPGRGGNEGHAAFTRVMIDELGYVYGPYNNFTDLAPVNANWTMDRTARTADNQLKRAWYRCYGPKPLYAVEACEELSPVIQRTFGFNTAYCDVHTATTPWSRTDYDARVPGAGTFAQTFYAYGEIMLLQKKAWGGPVYSEGGTHWLYCGLADGNYAQDQEYRPAENPWLVDFDLLRLHPLSCNFGMGAPSMFWGDGRTPKDAMLAMDRFLAATVAFGHPGFLLSGPVAEPQSYFMIQAVAARYTQADAAKIRYADESGAFMDTSRAVVTGAWRGNRVAVRYSDGTVTAINGGETNAPFLAFATPHGTIALPPNGFCVLVGDGAAVSVSAERREGGRGDIACSDEYVFVNGRGRMLSFAGGGCDGLLARVKVSDTEEDVVCRGATVVALPYAAEKIEAFDENGKSLGPAKFAVSGSETRLTPEARQWVCRVTRPPLAEFRPSVAAALAPFVRPKGWKAPPVTGPRRLPLPFRLGAGMHLRGGAETEPDPACQSRVTAQGVKCGGVLKDGYFMLPPYDRKAKKTGEAFLRFAVTPPKNARTVLSTSVGKHDGSSPGDGILFRIEVRTDGRRVTLAEKKSEVGRWDRLEADLSPWAGRRVVVYLVTDPGAAGDVSGDWGCWSDIGLMAFPKEGESR